MIRPLARACLVIAFAGAGLALSPTVAVAASSSPGDIVVSTQVVTNTPGETLTTVYEKTYNSRGSLVSDSRITTNAADGIVVSDVTTASYGRDGRYLSSTWVYDGDGDGGLPAAVTVSTASYDKTGFLTGLVTTLDEDSDGVIDSTGTVSYGRDRKNRTSTTILTLGSPVVEIVQTLEATFDARGNLVSSVSFSDHADPTANDYRSASTSTYINRQLATNHHVSEILSPDGVPVQTLVSDATMTYDSHGNVVGTTTTQDYDGDGGVDATYTTTQTYDSKDRLVRAENLSEATGQPTFLHVTDVTYDAAGLVVALSTLSYMDGVLLRGAFDTATYDSKGRLLSYVTASDDDGDETDDRTTTLTNTYDGKGRLVVARSEDRDGSGSLTSSVHRTFAYTKTTVTETITSDFNGDGVIDQTIVNTNQA